MTASPKLVAMVQEWRQLDAQGAMLGKEKKGKKADAVVAKATNLLHAIGDMEATNADDIMLKLDLACEAYGAATQDRAKFVEAGDPPLDFLYQSILDARRIVNGPKATTPEQIALLDAANVVSSLEDGIGSLVVIGNAMVEEEKTAEMRALAFTTCKLMEDVTAIDRAINVARGLPAEKH